MDQFSFLYSPHAAALGYTILYNLGQAFVIFLCLRIVLKFIPNASANVKYALSYCAYLGVGIWFFVTLFRQFSIAQQQVVVERYFNTHSFVNAAADNASSGSTIFSLSFLYDYLPLIVAFYLLGIVVYSIRLSFNFFQTNLLKSKGLHQLDFEWNEHIIALAKRMNISRKIQTYFSSKVNTPMMIGFIKPVILLPLAAMNHLTPEQFEAILLHELAHIRRNDYLLNIIQTVLDTLLFFNPFTWWITKYIREEREKSCDEIVLQLSDPFHYARALLALEEPLKNQPLVMTAVNNRSHLFHRIKNIMEMKNKQINYRQKFITLIVIAIATVSVAWLSPDESKLNKKEFQQDQPGKSYDVSALQVFSFYPFNFLADSTPNELVPVPPAPPIPPTPPVAMQRNGVPPLPPAAPVPPVAPDGTPLPPAPPVPPLPPHLGDTIPSGFFNSEAWKKEEEAIRKSTEEMRKYFQSDAWKKQQDLMKENAVAMKKYFNGPEWKKQQELMKKNGEEMKKYFNSPEWKKQQEAFKQNAEEMKKYFDSPAWKKQQESIKKSAEEMKKYFNSPEWKKQQELMKKHGEEMEKYFNSPEWKKQQKDLEHLADSSVSAYFKSDAWKQQQANIQKAVAQTQKFFQSDEWKKVQNDLEHLQWDQQKEKNDAELKKN